MHGETDSQRRAGAAKETVWSEILSSPVASVPDADGFWPGERKEGAPAEEPVVRKTWCDCLRSMLKEALGGHVKENNKI